MIAIIGFSGTVGLIGDFWIISGYWIVRVLDDQIIDKLAKMKN
jgi:hypothetical protein